MDMTPMPVEPGQTAGKSSTNLILIILVVILLLGNGATLYFLLKKPAKVQETNNNAVVTNEIVNVDTATTTNSETMLNEINDKFKDLKPLQVIWEKPSLVQLSGLVKNYADLEKYAKTLPDDGMPYDDFVKNVKVYKVGKIKHSVTMSGGGVSNGEYEQADLYIMSAPANGMAFRENFYRFIKSYDQIILLNKQSDAIQYDRFMQLFVNYGTDAYYLANLDTPNKISIPNTKYNLIRNNEEPYLLLSDFGKYEKVFDNVYKSLDRNCFFMVAPDQSVRVYYLQTDLLNDTAYNITQRADKLLDITWLDGSKNNDEYEIMGTHFAGCGSDGCYNYNHSVKSLDQLKVAGHTPDGSNVYELKDVDFVDNVLNQKILKFYYDAYYPGYDEKTQQPLPKISFETFLASHPIIFWQDPFGKFILFRNTDYVPMAECGKPVIYLYPTKTTDVLVQVNPTGGFTKTEPAYGNGWKVKAEPNGNLYNYQDQKNYPYLFWEGYALNYDMSNEGFVVAKKDVNNFLREKLAIQGLNEIEINDFMEFWLPRMQSDPYYFVTFVPQTEFDNMAPLTVSPRPDSVIRVFMDFKALDKPIQVKEQKLTTPKRIGFTVVEWGGEMQK